MTIEKQVNKDVIEFQIMHWNQFGRYVKNIIAAKRN
jgi:hypothetical protein